MHEHFIFRIEGLQELDRQLRALPERVAGNALATAVSAGARVIRNEAIARAPVDTGALKSQIFIKRLRSSSQSEKTSLIGVRGGLAKYANTKKNIRSGKAGQTYKTDGKTFYWKFIELGTSKMPAKPFLRPAFDTKEQDAVSAITEKLDQRIQKAIEENK
jgi:HK97 gp10 family phage protein